MTITALPTPPSPSDSPATFNSKAFDLLGALPTFVTEANGLEAENAAAATAAANAVLDSKLDDNNPSYTGTLTGGTGVVNLGSGQFVKDASGNIGLGATPNFAMMTYRAGATGTYHQFGNGMTGAGSGNGMLVGVDAAGDGTIDLRGTQRLRISVAGAYRAEIDSSGNLTPGGDNTQTNGSGAKRWSVIYAGTGTINTSDAREKTAVRSMATDEIEAAKALSKEVGVYQFLDSVAIKGDKARHHIGMTVQRAIEIMEAHGLNPFAYGFICYDKWNEETKEHPAIEAQEATDDSPAVEAKDAWTEVTLKAGDRYSFRYDQLSLFIARGIDARLAALEAK